MANECGQGILADALGDTEPKDHMHLGEVTVEFLLGHFIDTSHDVFVGLADGLSNFLEIPMACEEHESCTSASSSTCLVAYVLLHVPLHYIFFAM